MKDLYQKAKDSGTGVHKLIAKNLMYNASNKCVSHLLSVANKSDGGHLQSNEEAEAFAEAARISEQWYGPEGVIEPSGELVEGDKEVNHLLSANQCMETIREMMSEGITLYPAVVLCNRKMKIHEPKSEEVALIQEGNRDLDIIMSDEEVVESIKAGKKGYSDFVSRNKDKACALFNDMASDQFPTEIHGQHEEYPDWVKKSFESSMEYTKQGCMNLSRPIRMHEARSERKQLMLVLDTPS